MIPDDVVEEVRARAEADIVDIIGEYLPLKRAGKDYKAQCPFHEDRTPSFYVVPNKGFYKCFGCDESGDVFTFVMKKLGLDFVEAVKHVGSKVGVEVREVSRDGREEDPYRPFWEANAFARDFYRRTLADEEGGAAARAYLEERGIDPETTESFGLGYAPDAWRALRDAASRHDIGDEVLLEVGLLTTSEKAQEPYDRFRNRILFPIEGTGGKVLGFGGRVLPGSDEGAPKYLNSPESPVFHKGEVLYGLSSARHEIRREGAALIVEGYMDVVALAARDVENAVAPLGTSLTEEHARLLARYCKRVYLLFDSDTAGLKASFRAADVLLEAGLHPSVATLPPGEDPDSVARSQGAAGIREHVDEAVDVLDRKLQILEERDYFATIDKTRDAVDRLLPTLRAAADPALRDIYVSKVAERTGVQRETLEREIRGSGPTGGGPRKAPSREPRRRVRLPAGGHAVGMGAEQKLLLLLLRDRDRVPAAAERVSPEAFENAVYRSIYEALIAEPGLERVPDELSPQAARSLERLMASDEELSHGESVFRDVVSTFDERRYRRRVAELKERLARAERGGDQEGAKRLMSEMKDLQAERARRSVRPRVPRTSQPSTQGAEETS